MNLTIGARSIGVNPCLRRCLYRKSRGEGNLVVEAVSLWETQRVFHCLHGCEVRRFRRS